MTRRIVAVFAHPDDETFICGGALAKYAKEGAEITLVCATKGNMGRRMGNPPFANRETMPVLREQELRSACRELGISDLRFLGLLDKFVEYEDPDKLADRIKDVLLELEPDVVLTFHEVLGGHPDHCAIGKAATLAYRRSGIPNDRMRLYFISFGDVMRNPETFGFSRSQITVVDISSAKREKMRAFRAHRSQSEIDGWLWGSDASVIRRFGDSEYFIQGDGAARPGETGLFDFLGKR